MTFDTIVGFIWLQPALFAGPVLKAHQAFGIWTAYNVFLNYTASTLHSPGKNAQLLPHTTAIAVLSLSTIHCQQANSDMFREDIGVHEL